WGAANASVKIWPPIAVQTFFEGPEGYCSLLKSSGFAVAPGLRPQRARPFKGPSKRLHTFGISVTTGLSSSITPLEAGRTSATGIGARPARASQCADRSL